jgi:surfeit locus 1 family protein
MKPVSQRVRFVIVTAAALAMTVLTFSLGQWQLARAAQKEALQKAIQSQAQLPVIDGTSLLRTDESGRAALIHRRIQLKGKWLQNQTVYLDNRPMQGRPGFWVLTPLQLEDASDAAAVLVQRGWIPRDFQERTRLAPVTTPDAPVAIEGRIAPAPAKLYQFDGAETGRIRQNLSIAAFAQEIGVPLVDVLVLQTGPASEGLQRDWPEPASGVDKHYGYAFQWFALSALVAGLYTWFQLIAPRRQKKTVSTV